MPVKKLASQNERRKAIRANRVVAISHRLIKRRLKNRIASWSLSTTKNMSISGLLFMSEVPYKVGDIVEVNVVVSGMIDIIKGLARVVRVAEAGDTSFEVAVQLVGDKPKKRPAKSHR